MMSPRYRRVTSRRIHPNHRVAARWVPAFAGTTKMGHALAAIQPIVARRLRLVRGWRKLGSPPRRRPPMTMAWLDHVNIRTANLEAVSKFYSEILGLRKGPRPPFGFPGA